MKKVGLIVCGIIILGIMLGIGHLNGWDAGWDKRGEICKETIQSGQGTYGKLQEKLNRTNYEKGVNDALGSLTRFIFELSTRGEVGTTYGEMGDIIREMLGVKKEAKDGSTE